VMFDTYPKGALTKVYRLIALTLFVIGVQALAFATPTPEIDPASAGSALALLGGVVVLVRGRRK